MERSIGGAVTWKQAYSCRFEWSGGVNVILIYEVAVGSWYWYVLGYKANGPFSDVAKAQEVSMLYVRATFKDAEFED